jgi:diguanylate cyclase (GGDEF)-like protein
MGPGPAHAGMLTSVIESAHNMIAVADYNTGSLLYLNPAGVRLMGLIDETAVRSRKAPEFFTDVGVAQAPEIETALLGQGHWEGRSEFRNFSTGEPIPVIVSFFVTERSARSPAVIACIAQDLRVGEEYEQRLHVALEAAAYRAREQEALAGLSQLAVDGDLDHVLALAADAAAVLMGVTCASVARAEQPGGVLRVLAYRGNPPAPKVFAPGARSQPGYAAAVNDVVIYSDRVVEHRFTTEDMSARGLRSGLCIPIGAEPVWGVLTAHSARPREYTDREVMFLRSVTAVLAAAIRRIEAEDALRHRSLHDPLTGLANRELAHRQIDAALVAAREGGHTVATLLIDLDGFKVVNDRFGHASGDEALVLLAEQLQSAVRSGDTVARIGGDEFLIVCPDITSAENAVALATRITELQIRPCSDGLGLRFTASVGIAIAGPADTRETLIHRADTAMYQAKASRSGYAVAP